MRKLVLLAIVTVVLVAATGCAPGPNELTGSERAGGEPAGFWLGLWHGFIVLFSFVGSLLSDGIRVYEVHNTGGWYDFGFLLGVMMFFGGGGGGACSRSRGR